MATLWCSVLLGSGFDAFVVNGRAQKHIALSDQSGQPCPDLEPSVDAAPIQSPDLKVSANGGQGRCRVTHKNGSPVEPSPPEPSLRHVDVEEDSRPGADARLDHSYCLELEVSGTGSAKADMATRSPSEACGDGVRVPPTAALLPTAETANQASDVATCSEGPSESLNPDIETQDEAADSNRLVCKASSSSADVSSVHAWVLVKANRKVRHLHQIFTIICNCSLKRKPLSCRWTLLFFMLLLYTQVLLQYHTLRWASITNIFNKNIEVSAAEQARSVLFASIDYL